MEAVCYVVGVWIYFLELPNKCDVQFPLATLLSHLRKRCAQKGKSFAQEDNTCTTDSGCSRNSPLIHDKHFLSKKGCFFSTSAYSRAQQSTVKYIIIIII